MNSALTLAPEDVLTSFAVRHSPDMPTYYELALEDHHGTVAHWVVPSPLKQLTKHPVLLWQLPAAPLPVPLHCLETGAVQLVSPHPDTADALRLGLEQGVLRLSCTGQLLRGYYRLHRLAVGDGQLWQLSPTGRV